MAKKRKSQHLQKVEKTGRAEQPGENVVKCILNADKNNKHEGVLENENQHNESLDKIKIIELVSNSNASELADLWTEHNAREDSGKTQKNLCSDLQFIDREQFDHEATDARKIGALFPLDASLLTDTAVSGKHDEAIKYISGAGRSGMTAVGYKPAIFPLTLIIQFPSPGLGTKDSNNFKQLYASHRETPLKASFHSSRTLREPRVEDTLKRSGMLKKTREKHEDVPKNYSDSELDLPVKNLVLYDGKEKERADEKYVYPSKYSEFNNACVYTEKESSQILALDGLQHELQTGPKSSMKSGHSADIVEISHPIQDLLTKPQPRDGEDSRIQSGSGLIIDGKSGRQPWRDEERGNPDRFGLKPAAVIAKKDEDVAEFDGKSIDQNAPRLQALKRKNSGDPGEDWGNEQGDGRNRRWPDHRLEVDPFLKIQAALLRLHPDTVFTPRLPEQDGDDESEQDIFSSLCVGSNPAGADDVKDHAVPEICSSSQTSLLQDVKEYDELSMNSTVEEQPENTQQILFEQHCQTASHRRSSLLSLDGSSGEEDRDGAHALPADLMHSRTSGSGNTGSRLPLESGEGSSTQQDNPGNNTAFGDDCDNCEILVRDNSIHLSNGENRTSLEGGPENIKEPEGESLTQPHDKSSATQNELGCTAEEPRERNSKCCQQPTWESSPCTESDPVRQDSAAAVPTTCGNSDFSIDDLETDGKVAGEKAVAVDQACPLSTVEVAYDGTVSPLLRTPIQVSSPGDSGPVYAADSDFVPDYSNEPYIAAHSIRDEEVLSSASALCHEETQGAVGGPHRPVVVQKQGCYLHAGTQAVDNCRPFVTEEQLYSSSSMSWQETTPHQDSSRRTSALRLSSYSSAREMPHVHNDTSQTESLPDAPVQLPPITVHSAASLPPWATTTARIDLSRATNREFVQLRDRRATYGNDWPNHSGIDAANMALAGFYQMEGGVVRCFYCGLELSGLHSGNDIWDEHVRKNPDCTYLVAIMGGDV